MPCFFEKSIKRIMYHDEKCGGNDYNILIYQYNFVSNGLSG